MATWRVDNRWWKSGVGGLANLRLPLYTRGRGGAAYATEPSV